MTSLSLTRRNILVVENEPLIALDIADCLRAAGASVRTAHSLAAGLRLAAHRDLSAAVLIAALPMLKVPNSANT